jgi:GxxExxY protein
MSTVVDRWLAEERLTHEIIGAFFRVYNTLGFGFLEHVYAAALERELMRRGLSVSREHWVRIYYDGVELCQQRLDFVVEEKVVVEIKSTFELHKSAARQIRSYLRATDLEVGLLFHFGPEAKFYRLYVSNDRKGRPDTQATKTKCATDRADGPDCGR